MTIEEIWNKSLSKIEGKIGGTVYDLWFKPIKLSHLKEQTATLEIPNRFFKEWIEDSYPNLIKESIETVVGYPVTLTVQDRGEAAEQSEKNYRKTRKQKNKTCQQRNISQSEIYI